MRDLEELGIVPRRKNPYPPATDEQVEAFEAAFGVTLPDDFVAFLKAANGGRPTLSSAYQDPAGGTGEVDDFHGLGPRAADEAVAAADPDDWDVGDLWGETRVRREYLGRGVPFGRDGGDNPFFLDFACDPPCVSRYAIATRTIHRIAPSFSAFLDLLRPASDT